jgi:polyhydroxybutyrate depolymerase
MTPLSTSERASVRQVLRRTRVTALVLRSALVAAAIVAFGTSVAPAQSAHSAGPAWPYTVYRPASLSKAKPVPLILVPGGDISYMQRTTNFNQAADRGGFVVVYPQIVKSYNDVAHAQGETAASPYPDMLFLSDVIDKVTAAENIDPSRVYMTGFSLGGTMSYRAGCILASKLAGIAPVAGVVVNPNCAPSKPVSVFAVNGSNDSAAPYNGGGGFMSVSSTIDLWKGFDGCAKTSNAKATSGAVTTETWSACKSGAVVQLATIATGSHIWPGQPGLSKTSPDGQLDATSAISSFILSVPHAAAPTAPALTATISSVSVKQGKPRRIVVKLASNTAGTLRATLLLGKKPVASHVFAARAGTTSMTLPLSTGVKSGSYHLTLALKTASGPKVFQRSVRIPR